MNLFEQIYTFQTPFISSASGLLLHRNHFYIVADDERSLICLPSSLEKDPTLIRLIEGELPEDKSLRKKMKPDFESIIHLPANDTLLCLPSGSAVNRNICALVDRDYRITELLLKNTYNQLREIFPELNIEGGVARGNMVRLFQRGNGKMKQNAIIEMELSSFLKDEMKDLRVRPTDLGDLKSTPLSFTDACQVGSDCFFLAVAEDTESTYLDGEFLGAVLGKMNLNGDVMEIQPIDIPYKPEGLCIEGKNMYVVTDADDRTKASCLYKGLRA